MIDDPEKMMKGIIWLAPEMNMRTALMNLLDYIFSTGTGDDEADEHISVEDILNVVMESLVKLHHHVGEPLDIDTEVVDNITETDVQNFINLLGLIPETKPSNEEDNNDNS